MRKKERGRKSAPLQKTAGRGAISLLRGTGGTARASARRSVRRSVSRPDKPDRFDLYEKAVQNAEFEAQMIRNFYRRIYNQSPCSLKEDFCGTFALCRNWVEQNRNHQAIGIDLDPAPLQWGQKRHLAQMDENARKRLTILQKNVLAVRSPKVDIIAAFNFSYWIFCSRPELKRYFQNAHRSLNARGILILDAFGGAAAEREQEEERSCDGFTYVWEQVAFYPVTREMLCYIHFRLKDGTLLKRSFVYYWRLWTPVEISELLKEAGFQEVHWYFEGTDPKSEEGNGIFRRTTKGENAETWIAYAVAVR